MESFYGFLPLLPPFILSTILSTMSYRSLLPFLFLFLLFFGAPIRAESNSSQQTGVHLESNSAPQLPTRGTASIDLESGDFDETFSDTKEENGPVNIRYRLQSAYEWVLTLRNKKKKRERKKSTSHPADLSELPHEEEGAVVAPSNTRRSPAVTKERKNDKLKVNEIANSDCLRCTPWTPELRSATEYYEKGITFKAKKLGRDESILDISFRWGILYIPKLSVNDKTCNMLRNYIKSEQTKPNQKGTAYLQFWASLAREPKDVNLLSEKGIISINHKRAKEVVELIQSLYKESEQHPSGESYLEPMCQQLDKYCDCMIWKWFVKFIRKFNFFAILAFMIPIVALIFAGFRNK